MIISVYLFRLFLFNFRPRAKNAIKSEQKTREQVPSEHAGKKCFVDSCREENEAENKADEFHSDVALSVFFRIH